MNHIAGDDLEDLSEWVLIFLNEVVNEILAEGHQLPVMDGIRLANVRMKMKHRATYIQGDIELDRRYLAQMTRSMLKRIKLSVENGAS